MLLTLFVWTSKWRLIYLSPPCFCLFPALTRTPQQNHDCRPSALASLYYRLRKGDTSWPWPWWVWPSLHCIIALKLKASKQATGARFFLKKITTPWPLRGRGFNPSGQPEIQRKTFVWKENGRKKIVNDPYYLFRQCSEGQMKQVADEWPWKSATLTPWRRRHYSATCYCSLQSLQKPCCPSQKSEKAGNLFASLILKRAKFGPNCCTVYYW